jgi:uncharacterized protein
MVAVEPKTHTRLADPERVREGLRRAFILAGACALLTGAVAAAAIAPAAQQQRPSRLVMSNNPYLLMHAHDSVDWYPWGGQAFREAKRLNKPILVSIGYSSCYWCHVAEQELYSNPSIAKQLNAWFINVLIDREERPDLDGIYMEARLLISGAGGWPNNVFLTPDLKPFFAGGYFPPDKPQEGVTTFPAVLSSMHDAWMNRRDDLLRQGDLVVEAMNERRPLSVTDARFDPRAAMTASVEYALKEFDWENGGITGSEKFPRETTIALLLAEAAENNNVAALYAARRWLDAMALGGVRDQLDGGFHRYSTDSTWSVPHFEKMLYDNAQLLGLYVKAWQVTGSPLYRDVANSIADFLTEQLASPAGGFYASLDAALNGEEGAGYTWTTAEIAAILGESNATRFFEVYSLSPHVPDADSRRGTLATNGVLRTNLPLPSLASRADSAVISSAWERVAPLRRSLLGKRQHQPRPARDEKILVAWNGLAIRALADAADILHRRDCLTLATDAAERIWREARDPRTHELYHEILNGRSQGRGFLQDYALVANAFLTLAAVTRDTVWHDRARQLSTELLARFYKKGSLSTGPSISGLIVNPRDAGDDMMPSGTSATVELLSRLADGAALDSDSQVIPKILSSLGNTLAKHPERWPSLIVALSPSTAPLFAVERRIPGPAAVANALHSAAHVKASGMLRHDISQDVIDLKVAIDAGYHLNAHPATLDYLVPTTVTIAEHPDAQVFYPDGTVIMPAFSAEGLRVYQGNIAVKVLLAKNAVAHGESVYGDLTVQACTNTSCLPPDTIRVPIETR